MIKLRKRLNENLNRSILIGVTVCVLLVSGVAFGNSMYSARNIQSMAFQIPEFGMFALAMMLSNLIGGIDLSIIANANTVAILTAYVLNGTWALGLGGSARILFAIFLAILCSVAFGGFNGFLISQTAAPPLIATLGTMTLFKGIGMAITGGSSVGKIDKGFALLGKLLIANVPFVFWVFIITAAVLGAVLWQTGFGRKLYLYGENATTSRFSGIHNEKMCMWTFILTGLLAGMAGLIILSRVNSAKVGYGDSYLLQTLIVCVIGGIDPNGGKGKVGDVLIAIVMMQIMSSAFTIMALSPYTQKLIWGVMLTLVLGLNHLLKNYSMKKLLKASTK